MRLHSAPGHRGFSLIEVLIALVVLATGMLAIAALQTALTRASTLAKSRSVAVSTAHGVLEDLRAQIIRNRASYDDLAIGGPDDIPAYRWTLGTEDLAPGESWGETFTVEQTVERMVRTRVAAECSPQPAPCYRLLTAAEDAALGDSEARRPELKRITLSVSWTDATGETQQLTMVEITPSVFNDGSLSKIDNPFRNAGVGSPVVRINVPTDAGVIPIAVSDGSEESAASNPKPVIYDRGQTDQTRFEILTYAPDASATDEAVLSRRIDVAVVGCRCTTNVPVVASPTFFDRVRTPSYWDGFRYTPIELHAESVQKRGYPITGRDVSQDQELCLTCCSDHHDYPDSKRLVDPFRAQDPEAKDDVTNGAHNHYKVNVGADVSWTLAGDDTGGEYNEVCRMIRIDGFWTVVTDPLLLQMSLLATDIDLSRSLRTAVPDQSGTPSPVERYTDFVKDVLADRFLAGPAVREGVNAHDPLAPGNAIEPTYSDVLVDPAQIDRLAVGNDFWFLHDRGIIVDFLEDEAIDALKQALADCKAEDPGADSFDCILPHLPIVSINTTDLARWRSQNLDRLTVSNLARNSPIIGGDPATGNRGVVDAKSRGAERAFAQMFRSSSAIADVFPIDPHDGADTAEDAEGNLLYDYSDQSLEDSQLFCIDGACDAGGGSGRLSLAGRGGNGTVDAVTVGVPVIAATQVKLEFFVRASRVGSTGPQVYVNDLGFALVAVDQFGNALGNYPVNLTGLPRNTSSTGVNTLVGISSPGIPVGTVGWKLRVTNGSNSGALVAISDLRVQAAGSTGFDVVIRSSAAAFGFTGLGLTFDYGNCAGVGGTTDSRTFRCVVPFGESTTGLRLTVAGFNSVGSQLVSNPCGGAAIPANVCRNYVASNPLADAFGGVNGRQNETAVFNLPEIVDGLVHTIEFGEDLPGANTVVRPVVDSNADELVCAAYKCSCDGNNQNDIDFGCGQ